MIIGLQDGALNLLMELKNIKMSLEMLQVIYHYPHISRKAFPKMAKALTGSMFQCLTCFLSAVVHQSWNVCERREET